MSGKSRREKRKKNKGAFLNVIIVAAVLIAALSFQCVHLYRQNEAYARKEEEIKTQLSREKERQEEIDDYGDYVKTDEYVIDMAREKLGLVFDGETVFREEDGQ